MGNVDVDTISSSIACLFMPRETFASNYKLKVQMLPVENENDNDFHLRPNIGQHRMDIPVLVFVPTFAPPHVK